MVTRSYTLETLRWYKSAPFLTGSAVGWRGLVGLRLLIFFFFFFLVTESPWQGSEVSIYENDDLPLVKKLLDWADVV